MIKELDKIIEWYSTNYGGMSIVQMMDMKSKLLGLLYRFSEELASSKRDSIISTVFRKSEHHKFKSQLIEDGFTVGLAESKSVDHVAEKMRIEAEHESLNYRQKLIYDLGIKIVDDLQQRISVSKQEMMKTY